MASSSSRKSNSSVSRASRSARPSGVRISQDPGARFSATREGVRRPSGHRAAPTLSGKNHRKGASSRHARSSVRPSRPRTGAGAGAPALAAKVIAGALVLLLAGVVVWTILGASGAFSATDIQVESSEHVSKKDAEALISVPAGTSLLSVDEQAIGEGLEQNPWVAGVTVQKRFPHTLVITPSEKKVEAIVYLSSEDLVWAISADRTWIAPISLSVTVDKSGNLTKFGTAGTGSSTSSDSDDSVSSDQGDSSSSSDSASDTSDSGTADSSSDTSDASDTSDDSASDDDSDVAKTNKDGSKVLTGKSAARAIAKHYGALLLVDAPNDMKPASGKAVSSRVVSAGLDYAEGFSSDFRSKIKEMSVASREAVSCTLASGVKVSLGSPSEIQKKERVVTKLLEQEKGVTYINVRTPGSYTYRSVSTS